MRIFDNPPFLLAVLVVLGLVVFVVRAVVRGARRRRARDENLQRIADRIDPR